MPATRRRFMSLGLMAGFALAAAPLRAAGPGISTGKTGVAIQGYDSHAYWAAGAPRPGDPAFTIDWQGVPWHFATRADADAFAAAPESFAPQFGGFCTRAMSLGSVVDGDPEVWRIFKGRLYLFARPVGGRKFDGAEAEMIAKAQAHWDSLH